MCKILFRFLILEILSVFSILLSGKGFSQTFPDLGSSLPLEKVYLHTDRTGYMAGDTIWFKGYVWYGQDQHPDTTSMILYAELYSPDGEKLQSKKLLIESGTLNGDFTLDENSTAGDYTLTAYTQLIKEYGNGAPFSRAITVNSPEHDLIVDFEPVVISNAGYDSLQVNYRLYDMGSDGSLSGRVRSVDYRLKVSGEVYTQGSTNVYSGRDQEFKYSLSGVAENDSLAVFELTVDLNDTLITREVEIPLHENIDLQFFPEGGTLISNHPNKIAFKAIGVDGFSREVNGIITDNTDKLITGFNTTHKGMGSFEFIPEEGKQYTARFEYNGKAYECRLPEAEGTGSSIHLGFEGNQSGPVLTIYTNDTNPNNQKYIAATSLGQLKFIEPIDLNGMEQKELSLSTEKLPEGITRLTLLNGNYHAECERLFYVDKGERFKVEITADSASYNSRSKVSLEIKATNLNGEPVQTNLSLAAVDKDQMGEGSTTDISTYKLLTSELTGYIEDAGYYFQNGKITDYRSLDLLMLTQGYRTFEVQDTGEETIELEADPDFHITGRIEAYNERKEMDYRELTLMLINTSGEQSYFETTPDSMGNFSFRLPEQYGEANCLLQVLNKRNKPFKGYIYLDESPDSIDIGIDQQLSNQQTGPTQKVDFVRQLQAVKKAEYEQELQDIAMSYTLDEVSVTARDMKWFRRYEENAQQVEDMDMLDPDGDKYKNLHDLLVSEFGATEGRVSGISFPIAFLPCMPTFFGPSLIEELPPFYVVNGATYFGGAGFNSKEVLLMMYDFDVSNIKKIMVIPWGDLTSHYCDVGGINSSLVVIETYDDTYRGDPRGVETLVIKGLDVPREFYSPNYEVPGSEDLPYDSRATLYWEPELITDQSGRASVEFFTSDTGSRMVITVNGIETGSGNPGRGVLEIPSVPVGEGSLSTNH